MALTIKKVTGAGKSTKTMADFLGELQKDFGESVGSFGGALLQSDRIPTGIFPLDLALGGGFPRGKITIVFGPESSSKTNLALLAVAQHQLLWPEKINVLIDMENGFDPGWAKKLGVNTDKLVVIKPSYGEQIVDMAESALYTDDCGMVVIDSIAAIIGTAEAEASAERAQVGGNSLLVGKLCRKIGLALGEMEKRGKSPTVVFINQIRSKVGIVYGNPETMPGGNAPKFSASMILRVYGKNVMDTKVSSTMPVAKEVKFVVNKWKCPVLSAEGMFTMATQPYKGFKVGQCDDFNTISEYLKAFGRFVKDAKKGWVILDEHYDTIQPFKDRLYADPAFGNAVRQQIVAKMLQAGQMLEDNVGEEENADG
jgi:recombination protein RecA